MSPMMEASQYSTDTVSVLDGLPTIRQNRRYSIRNRQSRATPVQGMGVRIQDRVKYILDQRYMAWGQKYEVRATWIM